MDYSIRSLNSKKASGKDKRRGTDGLNDDKMALIMRNARRVYESKGNKPIAINDLLNFVNKMDITVISRDELVSVLSYYQKLNVVYTNPDDQVMWL